MPELLSSTSSAIHTHLTISCYVDCHSHIANNCSQYCVQHDVCTVHDVTYLAKAYPAVLKPLNLEPFSGHIKWVDKGLGTNPSQRTAQKGTCPWQIHVFVITTCLLHCSKQKWVQCKMLATPDIAAREKWTALRNNMPKYYSVHHETCNNESSKLRSILSIPLTTYLYFSRWLSKCCNTRTEPQYVVLPVLRWDSAP